MRRKCGNPNWTNGAQLIVGPPTPTEFEQLANRLKLREHAWPESKQLREWAQENRYRRYVPEWLLKKWNLELNAELLPNT